MILKMTVLSTERKLGEYLSVLDLKTNKYYKCKIDDIHYAKNQLKLHWVGYKKKMDFWLDAGSERIEEWSAEVDVNQRLGKAAAAKRGRESDSDEEDNRSRKRGNVESQVASQPSTSRDVSSVVRSPSPTLDDALNFIRNLPNSLLEDSGHPDVPTLSDGAGIHHNRTTPAPTGCSPTLQVSNVTPPPRVGDASSARQGADSPQGDLCGFCSDPLLVEAVGCDRCLKKFHPRETCLGVVGQVISALLAGDGMINYVCCDCRIGGQRPGMDAPPRTGDSGLPQLLDLAKNLVSELNRIMNEVRVMRVQANNPVGENTRPNASAPPTATGMPSTNEVLAGIREIQEREKRKETVVFRGFAAMDTQQMMAKFQEVCTLLGVGHVEVSDMVKINDSLFRAKIVDSSKRLRLLAEAKHLKNSDEFKRAFIQRDLTYRQRQEIIAGRAERNERRQGGDNGDEGMSANAGGSDVPMQNANNPRQPVRGGRGGGRPRGNRRGRGGPGSQQIRRNSNFLQ